MSTKVAHCTQVHDIWPFGPLVYALIKVKKDSRGSGGRGAYACICMKMLSQPLILNKLMDLMKLG